jgi:4'-phosphopantetheinyl transferase
LDPAQVSPQASEKCFDQLLTADERDRCLRFVFDRDRHTFLVARSLLRRVLSRYRPVPPDAWRFALNDYGKPRISGPLTEGDIRFNLTHTRGLVALVVASGREVGIDAEHVERSLQWRDLVKDVLADREADHLASVSEPQQRRVFYQFWTLKEAYIKGCGKGLSVPLRSFWFEIIAGQSPQIQFAEPSQSCDQPWLFFLSSRFPKHTLAVAVESSGEMKLTWFSGSELF